MPDLALDHEVARRHVDRLEAPVAHPTQQQAVAGVVSPQDGRDPIEVPRDEEINVPVASEVARQHRVDGSELGLGGKRLEREGAVAVVQRDGAGELVRFQNLRLAQF